MKKLFIILGLLISIFAYNQVYESYTWKTTIEGKWILMARNDTVIVEPVFIGVGVNVTMNVNPIKSGWQFVIHDTEQGLIDYIENNNLKGSEYSLAQAKTNYNIYYRKGVVITNETNGHIDIFFKHKTYDIVLEYYLLNPYAEMSRIYDYTVHNQRTEVLL